MKKLIIVLFLITICSLIINNEKQVVIPNTAIRFRIIANSDSSADQDLKMQVKEELEPTIIKKLSTSSTIEEARTNIKSYIPEVETTLQKYTNDYDINYGENYFPEKEYKGISYPEGEYESLVITLGNGLGENWWCVLFPPLCLLEAEESEITDTEYKFYVKELLDKFMN